MNPVHDPPEEVIRRMPCKECSQPIPPERRCDAEYCSTKCRARAKQRRKRHRRSALVQLARARGLDAALA